ncbi:MAG: anti-sigma factor family protein [Candidatus Dormibacteria bacterium]
MTEHAHVEDEVLSAFVDGECTEEESATVLAALAECPECSDRHREMTAVVQAVRSLPRERAGELALDFEPIPTRAWRPWHSPRLVGATALAAALLTGALLGPRVIPDWMVGGGTVATTGLGLQSNLHQSAIPGAAPQISRELYGAATHVNLKNGGTLAIASTSLTWKTGQRVPLQLVLNGSSAGVSDYSLRASGAVSMVIATGPKVAADQAAGGPSNSTSGGEGRTAPAAQVIFDGDWSAQSADGTPLPPGVYTVTATVTLGDGTTTTVSMQLQLTAS